MPYCRECGAKLVYDRETKTYTCSGCGLTYTFQDLVVESHKTFEERRENEKKRRREEYLEWWLSKKQ